MTEQQQETLKTQILARYQKAREQVPGYEPQSQILYLYLKALKALLGSILLGLGAAAYVLTVLWFFPAIRLGTSDMEAWAFGLLVVITGIPTAVFSATRLPRQYHYCRAARKLAEDRRRTTGEKPAVSPVYLYFHHSSMKDAQLKALLVCMGFMLGMFTPLLAFLLATGLDRATLITCGLMGLLLLFCTIQLVRALCIRKKRKVLQQLWQQTVLSVLTEAQASGYINQDDLDHTTSLFQK